MSRCKTCGREYPAVQTMTYAVYGFCSWDCLMKKKARVNTPTKGNRKNQHRRNDSGNRSKWAQNY